MAGDAPNRQQRRRDDTRREIMAAAMAVMSERGVAGLSLSEVARRVGMRQPSLYKHFPSLHGVYDALFREGAQQQLDSVRLAVRDSRPGLAALMALIEAIGRHAMANPVQAQLLAWRPVPDFQPSAEAFAPSIELVAEVRGQLRAAVEAGELHPDAGAEDAEALLSILVTGTLSQQLANQPDAGYDGGRFTALMPRVVDMFTRHYAPEKSPKK